MDLLWVPSKVSCRSDSNINCLLECIFEYRINSFSLHLFQAGAFEQKLPFYIFPYFSSSHTRLLVQQGQSLEPITYIYCRSSIEGVITS